MKPAPFEYRAPDTLDEALALLTRAGRPAVPLAGGQSLMPLMNLRKVRPGTLVDLGRVPGLSGVRITPDAVRIGAMTTLRELEIDTALQSALPVVPQAAAHVGHLQIRHRATLGGSLCHADPAAQLPAVAVALGARLVLRGGDGVRSVCAEEFFTGAHSTARRPDELLTDVEFPRREGFRYHFEEVAKRGGAGRPLVGVCLGAVLDGLVVVRASIAVSGVADRPLRLRQAEAALAGRRLDSPLGNVPDLAADTVDPPSDLHGSAAYRRDMLRIALRRAAVATATARRPR
ncbi:FAD binding domain-containing protein [Streptomyces sp. NPDC004270]